jgi:hypothetical protein
MTSHHPALFWCRVMIFTMDNSAPLFTGWKRGVFLLLRTQTSGAQLSILLHLEMPAFFTDLRSHVKDLAAEAFFRESSQGRLIFQNL